MHSPYLPDDVTDEMIENAYGAPIPDAYCNCEHCIHFDSSWMICKLECKRNGITKTMNGKEIDTALSAMNEESDEFKEIAREYDDYCDDFEFDSNSVDDTPEWAD